VKFQGYIWGEEGDWWGKRGQVEGWRGRSRRVGDEMDDRKVGNIVD
jgi:hypothetical protein